MARAGLAHPIKSRYHRPGALGVVVFSVHVRSTGQGWSISPPCWVVTQPTHVALLIGVSSPRDLHGSPNGIIGTSIQIHPERLTWNLRMDQTGRRFSFTPQCFFRLHVGPFQGVLFGGSMKLRRAQALGRTPALRRSASTTSTRSSPISNLMCDARGRLMCLARIRAREGRRSAAGSAADGELGAGAGRLLVRLTEFVPTKKVLRSIYRVCLQSDT